MRRALVLAAILLTAFVPVVPAEPCSAPSGCEFWDDDHHMYILHQWDVAELDVLIVPGTSAFATRDVTTTRAAIDAWEAGIRQYGASWLNASFDIRHYTLGLDVPPPEALADPEIVVYLAEANPFLLFGIGHSPPFGVCADGPLGSVSPMHPHDGGMFTIIQDECEELGRQCIALNTNFLLGGMHRMYDLISHEFGHCLGIGHVGDAQDFDAKEFPANDIMSYQHDPSQVHCVSNLNVAGINGTFARTLGRPSSEWLYGGSYVHMDPADHQQASCSNPPFRLLP